MNTNIYIKQDRKGKYSVGMDFAVGRRYLLPSHMNKDSWKSNYSFFTWKKKPTIINIAIELLSQWGLNISPDNINYIAEET